MGVKTFSKPDKCPVKTHNLREQFLTAQYDRKIKKKVGVIAQAMRYIRYIRYYEQPTRQKIQEHAVLVT